VASSTREGESREGEVRLWRKDGWWIARDVETGVTTQGPSRDAALENLDEAVALHNGGIGREPTDEELRELGIDSADNTIGDREPPDVLDQTGRRSFSGMEVVEILVNAGGFEWRRTTGDHAQRYHEHPTNGEDCRQVTVPLHDELRMGTLRDIADSAGARDFAASCEWIDRNA